jgi:hypothetical protein
LGENLGQEMQMQNHKLIEILKQDIAVARDLRGKFRQEIKRLTKEIDDKEGTLFEEYDKTRQENENAIKRNE